MNFPNKKIYLSYHFLLNKIHVLTKSKNLNNYLYKSGKNWLLRANKHSLLIKVNVHVSINSKRSIKHKVKWKVNSSSVM